VADVAADITAAVRDAYGASAGSWATAPEDYYRRLADAIVASAPDVVRGATVLDVGTGTGAVAAAALAGGAARVVGTDLAFGMIEHAAGTRPAGVVANALSLPFASRSFDAVLAGCVLNHIAVPADALREMARVTRAGGAVLASAFLAGASHPVKDRVDAALVPFGFSAPDWHNKVKGEIEPLTASADRLASTARDAGIADLEVVEQVVDSGFRAPEDFVRFRLGMATCAPFVASLDDATRARVFAAALAAVGPDPEPYVTDLLVLVARVRAR
jgi:SAM-dependent methyltransferase